MAVYSDVLICNMALSRIGVLTLIEDINEASAEAQACKIFFNPSRDFVLGSANWPFLTRYAGLGLVATDPNDDWKASYRLPSDCIYAMRLVLAPGRIYTPAPPFAISGDAQGNLLLCDLTEANLEYIASQTNSGRFDDLLASAIAWRLASEISMPLGRSDAYQQRASNEYQRAVREAAASSFAETQRDPDPASSFEQARNGGTWWQYDNQFPARV